MWLLRFIALLGCAEWLLIFRTWVSFRYVLLFAGFTLLRGRMLSFVPHVDNNFILFPIAFLAFLYHLRLLWRGLPSHSQQTYGTPETGVSWLVIVAQNPKRAFALECAIIIAFIYYLAHYGNIVYPREFGALPQAWQAWLSQPSNVELFVAINALWMPFAYSLWNVAVSGKPLWRSRTAPRSGGYQYVREETHSTPKLPSVKDLSDDLSNFYS